MVKKPVPKNFKRHFHFCKKQKNRLFLVFFQKNTKVKYHQQALKILFKYSEVRTSFSSSGYFV